MKKTLAAALALTASSIALAAPALADDPPPVPVTPGSHTVTEQDGTVWHVGVALDCGPACFAWVTNKGPDEFHWAGDKWLDSNGIWTVDGITFTNRNGYTLTMS
ncbi:hypothetical protein [Mycobacterium sp. 1274761.0]|uniref:hypothetical protein n=1 Tax=Mycobacterium sp. 1274761.0 TaxID=1834077 RepID=UPI0007FFAE3B|nr:hypothetical protein [Mycobacterium sp. 1274761.0]OBK72906.1 hypothetical protein A5651_14275 [Mycobacterium sp. 1274761.0]